MIKLFRVFFVFSEKTTTNVLWVKTLAGITPLLDVTGWCYDHRSLSPPSWVSVSYYPGLNLSCESSEKTFKSTEHTQF